MGKSSSSKSTSSSTTVTDNSKTYNNENVGKVTYGNDASTTTTTYNLGASDAAIGNLAQAIGMQSAQTTQAISAQSAKTLQTTNEIVSSMQNTSKLNSVMIAAAVVGVVGLGFFMVSKKR